MRIVLYINGLFALPIGGALLQRDYSTGGECQQTYRNTKQIYCNILQYMHIFSNNCLFALFICGAFLPHAYHTGGG